MVTLKGSIFWFYHRVTEITENLFIWFSGRRRKINGILFSNRRLPIGEKW